MKRFPNYCLLVAAITALYACGSATILRPAENQYITSPFDFKVEKKGCGTLKVFFDRGTPREQEITNLFKYDKDNIWVAEKEVFLYLGGGAYEGWLEKIEIPVATDRSCARNSCFDVGEIVSKYNVW